VARKGSLPKRHRREERKARVKAGRKLPGSPVIEEVRGERKKNSGCKPGTQKNLKAGEI